LDKYCNIAALKSGPETLTGSPVLFWHPASIWHGESVGAAVGEEVGEEVGEKVGEEVGEEVGAAVGEKVGEEVGGDVGEGVRGRPFFGVPFPLALPACFFQKMLLPLPPLDC
jgi:hypothetical protein